LAENFTFPAQLPPTDVEDDGVGIGSAAVANQGLEANKPPAPIVVKRSKSRREGRREMAIFVLRINVTKQSSDLRTFE
jgi:hypothetical protein